MVNTQKNVSESLEIVVKTDPGMVRGHNEDAVLANPNLGLAILADGMGGYNAGEVASGMATTLLATELESAFAATPPHAIDRASGKSYAHRYLRDKIAATKVLAGRDLKAGEILDATSVRAIRPGLGLAPKFIDMVMGKAVKRDVKRGTPVSWDLLL